MNYITNSFQGWLRGTARRADLGSWCICTANHYGRSTRLTWKSRSGTPRIANPQQGRITLTWSPVDPAMTTEALTFH